MRLACPQDHFQGRDVTGSDRVVSHALRSLSKRTREPLVVSGTRVGHCRLEMGAMELHLAAWLGVP